MPGNDFSIMIFTSLFVKENVPQVTKQINYIISYLQLFKLSIFSFQGCL